LPFTPATVLEDGSTYTVCANGWSWYGVFWNFDGVGLGGCGATVVDRNRPAISASVNGAASYTNNPVLALRIQYADATSPPWFGPNGQASNWTCINVGAPCTPTGSPDPNCSVPNAHNSRLNSFDCRADATNSPDGDYWFCAIAADAAVPDNPTSPNQFASAFSANANLSDPACGHVVLDRAVPSVVAVATATSVGVGELVKLSASASDASGVSGQFDWNFGDNTAPGSGASTSHTYTRPGTYVVSVTIKDNAGNAGHGRLTITVRPSPGEKTEGGTTGVKHVEEPITAKEVSKRAGGGGVRSGRLGALRVLVPRRINLRRTQVLFLALSSQTSGRVQAALRRGSPTVSRGAARLGGPGAYAFRLKLPRGLRTGTYSLTLSFRRDGASRASTKSFRIRVNGTRRPTAARAASRSARTLRGIPAKPRPLRVGHSDRDAILLR
jgi:hypothetical protein